MSVTGTAEKLVLVVAMVVASMNMSIVPPLRDYCATCGRKTLVWTAMCLSVWCKCVQQYECSTVVERRVPEFYRCFYIFVYYSIPYYICVYIQIYLYICIDTHMYISMVEGTTGGRIVLVCVFAYRNLGMLTRQSWRQPIDLVVLVAACGCGGGGGGPCWPSKHTTILTPIVVYTERRLERIGNRWSDICVYEHAYTIFM